MITSFGQRGEAKEMEAIGFAGYLTRPFHRPALIDMITLLLTAKRERKRIPLVTRHTVSRSASLEQSVTTENIAFGAHILVAEDNRINQMMVTQMLEMMDCKVDIAGNGKEAIEMVRQFDYDLVLMDCMMPEVSGYEATRTIRKLDGEKRNINIIALTANALQGDRQKCLEAGMSDYLSKPVKKPELQAMLAKWLAYSSSEAERKNMDTRPAPESGLPANLADVMDRQVWSGFLELVGDQAAGVLHKHCGIARGYLRAIHAALDAKNYKAVADAVHPLKSSSQQIGALEVARLAARIEEMCRGSAPNPFVLQDLARNLEQQQKLVEKLINQTFAERKTA